MKNGTEKLEQKSQRRMWSIVTIGIVLLLIGLTVFNYWRQPKDYEAKLIAQDLRTLLDIFAHIDKECKILSFDSQQNTINFLNVGSFAGSEVGPMNLGYPTQWKGPYLLDNPQIQGVEYQIVSTKKGYFITPGNSVKLPNGKIIGKDIILDENADIEIMASDENALKFKNISLAVPLPLSTTLFQKLIMENIVDSAEDMV